MVDLKRRPSLKLQSDSLQQLALVTGPLRGPNSPEKVEVDRTESVYTLLKRNVLWKADRGVRTTHVRRGTRTDQLGAQ
jgi:hypothetical protein